jgi:hypothetical protein
MPGYFLREHEDFLIRQHGQRHLGLPDHPDKLRPNTAPRSKAAGKSAKTIDFKIPLTPLWLRGKFLAGMRRKRRWIPDDNRRE